MQRLLGSLPVLILVYFLKIRFMEGKGCITTQNDTGALLIQSLHAAVDAAECKLVDDVAYTDYTVVDGEVFDFIVVGAGSAGCVVANRLSENPEWRVLLLEAGGLPAIVDQVPGLVGYRINTEAGWQYRTQPDPNNCLGAVNGSCPCPRGKLLGGSSSINAMLYVRGNPMDFMAWGDSKSSSWKYEDMLYYFKKSEGLESKEIYGNEDVLKYHGTGGYLKIDSYKGNIEYFKNVFSDGFKQLGLEYFNDVNAHNHEGLFTLQGTLHNGRRCSTASAFLHDFQTRPNLKISVNSLVTKILIDENKQAFGVEFTKAGITLQATASKEVIVSCGAINSPQLLMLSGIGPQEHLEEIGIDVIQDLKVGYNFQDHISTRGVIVTLDIPPSILESQVVNTFKFLVNGEGTLAGLGTSCISGFIKTSQASYPNVQLDFMSLAANSSIAVPYASLLGFTEDIQQSIAEINSKRYTVFLAPTIMRPKSRGRILLKNNDPNENPLIFSGYLQDYQDMEVILEAIEFVNALTKTGKLQTLNAAVEYVDVPGCRTFKFQSKPYWECITRHMSVTAYHPVGTCKMGSVHSRDSVVDVRLRVIGVNNLRVIDASVMSHITSGNTNAPTIAIAEKGSDLIKEDWE